MGSFREFRYPLFPALIRSRTLDLRSYGTIHLTTRIPSRRKVLVSLVEEHKLARAHLRLILSGEQDFRVAEIDPRALKPSRTPTPEIFVLSHVTGSMLERYVKLIHRVRKTSKILLVAQPSRVSAVLSLLRSGVHGFVSDEEVEADLRMAVRTLIEGRVWVRSSWLGSDRLNHDSTENAALPGVGSFTTQQSRVVELVRENLSNKQIGAELGISERTVKFHLRNIFMSLGIDNRHAIRDLPSPKNCPTGQSGHNFQLPCTARQ